MKESDVVDDTTELAYFKYIEATVPREKIYTTLRIVKGKPRIILKDKRNWIYQWEK